MYSDAITAFRNRNPVLIFDADTREGETDIVIPSQFITPDIIRIMRKDAGGLICTTVKQADAEKIGLPYIEDLFRKCLDMDKSILNAEDMKYDKDSTFSITINSRDTFTGISDNDRSLTVQHFAGFLKDLKVEKISPDSFGSVFRTPGHIHLLIARDGYFSRRRGHTELSTYLVEQAGLIPSATIVEMLDDNGKSMTRDKTENYARKHGYGFATGEEIISEWSENH
ncbi:MAG: 3,4-dihydroxy-2-butanone-4-phosphate synthase [Ferroplasma sp.]|uniref:3,4-dihydroxy-2-butanone-4-phosphate synthase n=1 Tax=Ferroplasma sp. TaxID=2591003 RepID=UPI0028165006|nr:3,4-dihydroxy-2-butanone-4-phosphate synthase [Ferroplasma sp.]WMT51983.1 MAG: 3,4-dihydroxy-2-butanone-4-phosphate synthase [Ferroplasma sp.]